MNSGPFEEMGQVDEHGGARMITVALAEDESLIRDALGTLLGLEDDLEVSQVFSRGDQALEWMLANPVDVAVLDNDMPGLSGLSVAEELGRRPTAPATIILSGKAHPADLRRALQVPVLGFCTKGIPGSQLAEAIRTVFAGRRWIDPDLAAMVIAGESNPLRDREIEVLRLVGAGLSTPEIAKQLYLGAGTVRNYVSGACTKLGVSTKIAAVHKAIEAGWL